MARFSSPDGGGGVGSRGPQGTQGIQGENASDEFKMKTTTSIIDLQYHTNELRRLHQ
jgi:hypothetical protein